MSPATPPVFENITANGNGRYGLRVNTNPGNLPGTLSGSGNGFNGIYVNGNLGGTGDNGSFTWESGYLFPIICNSVTMAAGDTLSCLPGTVVKMNTISSSLNAYGTLLAPGGSFPVWFTSIKDDIRGGDTNGDGDATAPAPGDHWGIFLNGNSHLDLTDFWIGFGGGSGYSNFQTVSGTVPQFKWNRGASAWSLNDGIRVNVADLDFTRLRIIDNGGDGLEVFNQGTADVHDCDIQNNGSAGIRNTSGTNTVDAQGNWWGDASGPLDTSPDNPHYNPAGLGDEAVGRVAYLAYLSQPPANQAPGEFLALDPDAGSVFQTGPITFTWTQSIDPDGEAIYYNLEISRNADFTDIYLVRGDIPGQSVTIDAADLEPDHTSWWRVVAKDGFFGETIAAPFVRAIIQGSSISPVQDETTFSFAVGRSWPNPSSQGSSLSFALPSDQRVRVDVYDIRGRLVQTVTDQVFSAGQHTLQWDGRDTGGRPSADGLYFYRLKAPSGERVRKVMIVK
jgi:hypothetical protein